MKQSLFALTLIFSPTLAAAASVEWRDQAPNPGSAACPMQKLETFFWDYLENGDKPVHEPEWKKLGAADQAALIQEHCEDAVRVQQIFVDVKVRLDFALRIARSGDERNTVSDKISLIDRTLSETKGSSGMVQEKLGEDSDLVMVLRDTRIVLSKERSNLAAKRGSEHMDEIQAKGSLQNAGRIRGGGRLAEQKADGDRLFDGEDSKPALVRSPETIVYHGPSAGAQRGTAAGALRGGASKYESPAVKEVPRPIDPDSATGKALKSIRNAFGNKEPVEKAPPPAPRPKAEPIEGYSSKESKFIQSRKDDAWFGFGWLAERRAKLDVDSVRSSVKNCAEKPNFCAKIEEECRQDPELQGSCNTLRNRKKILGY